MLEELRIALFDAKRNKTPGPDEIPTEFLKELNQTNRVRLLVVINDWWLGENMPEDVLLARVVLIYKKGDSSKCENYRPISLSNTIYKIMARVIQMRIDEGIEQDLQKTQYGFRKKRGTQEALYCIRRAITAGESSQNIFYYF